MCGVFQPIASMYDKRGDFKFQVPNCPFMNSYIPQSPTSGLYDSYLKRFARTSSEYNDLYRQYNYIYSSCYTFSFSPHQRCTTATT